jgi:hypothetical protein
LVLGMETWGALGGFDAHNSPINNMGVDIERNLWIGQLQSQPL